MKQLQSFILPIVLHLNKGKLTQLLQCTFQWIIQETLWFAQDVYSNNVLDQGKKHFGFFLLAKSRYAVLGKQNQTQNQGYFLSLTISI